MDTTLANTLPQSLQDGPLEAARRLLQSMTKEERDALLFTKKFQCDFCEDKKVVAGNYAPGHKLFGRLFPCPKCNMHDARTGITDDHGLYASDYYLKWGSVLEVGPDKAVLGEIKEYLQTCQARGWGFTYLWGKHGNGKSEIGRVLAVMSTRANLQTHYISMFDLLSLLYSGEAGGDERTQATIGRMNFDERLRYVGDADVLILDEFDKIYEDKKGNNWITMFQLLNRRYDNAMRGKSGLTLIISNEEPESIKHIPAGMATYSRLLDDRAKIFHLTGDSLRPMASRLEKLK